jgi:hypothetical protein
MPRRLLALVFLLFSVQTFADTAFTANLRPIVGSNPGSYAVVLRVNNCSNYILRVTMQAGSAVLNGDTAVLLPNALGVISATVPDQANISCGSSAPSPDYIISIAAWDPLARKTLLVPAPRVNEYDVTGGSFNLNTATPRNAPPPAAVADALLKNSSGDQTVNVLAGKKILFVGGTVDLSGTTCIGCGTGGGSGLTNLNGLTAATQDFTKLDDTNVTITIDSSVTPHHKFTIGWTGSLAKARQHSATAYNDQANTFGAGLKQTFTPSATTAGLNHAGVTADPSTPAAGDLWFRSDLNHLKWRDGAGSPATHSLFNSDDTLPYSQVTGTGNIPNLAPVIDNLLGSMNGSSYSNMALLNCGDSSHALSYNTTTHVFACQSITGSAAAGGSNTQVQYNNTGGLSGITNMTSDGTNVTKLTAGAGPFDFSNSTIVKLRIAAGLTSSANGDCGYDTTSNRWHCWQGGADRLMIASTNVGAAGQVAISNADGSETFADPITSGNQAAATAQTITATGAKSAVTVTNIGQVLVTVSGTYAGVAFNFEASPDGTFTPAFAVQATQVDAAAVGAATGALPSNATRSWFVDVAGFTQFRVNATSFTSGTANITITPIYFQYSPLTSAQIVGTVPLPTGAATSAKQPALGTAGSPSTDVISVQGVASGTPLPISAASLPLPSGASTEATLALIKAKTDNIDVALSTRTKPADQQHVIVDTAPTTAVTEADGANTALGSKADAKSTATDTTPASVVSVLKQISAMVQSQIHVLCDAGTCTGGGGSGTGTLGNPTYVQSQGDPTQGAAGKPGRPGNLSQLFGGQYLANPPVLRPGEQASIQVDRYGRLITAPQLLAGPVKLTDDGNKILGTPTAPLYTALVPATMPASYKASTGATGFAAAASATDIFAISGSSTSGVAILVTRIVASCTQNTAGMVAIQVLRRSTADSAGTNITESLDDSKFGASGATVAQYTANPTLGTQFGGPVDAQQIGCMAAATASANDAYVLDLTQKPIVLRGAAEQLAVNLNGVTVTGNKFTITVYYMAVVGI